MSHDLFAAFGESSAATAHAQTVTESNADPWDFSSFNDSQQASSAGTSSKAATSATIVKDDDDDDDFGDFEDAAAVSKDQHVPSSGPVSAKISKEPATSTKLQKTASNPFPPKAQPKDAPSPVADSKIGRHPFADHMDFLFSGGNDEYDAGDDDLEDLSKNPEAAMEYSKRMIAEQEAQVAKKKPLPFSQPPVSVIQDAWEAPKRLQKKDPNVLFDADDVSDGDDEEDDDFGDFEAIVPAPQSAPKTPVTMLQKQSGPPKNLQQTTSKPKMPAIDLLGLNDGIAGAGGTTNGVMSPRSERVTSILGTAKTDSYSRPPASGSLLAKAPINQEDDAWDDFETAEPVLMPSAVPIANANSSLTAHNRGLTDTHSHRSDSELPPTNVPPPVVLLSAFASFFATAQETLFGPLSRLDAAQRQELLGHPATYQFLFKHLNSSIALAHIIAGRKLRWKRDQILAQSMRIGPSAAGGKGGMKLTSIDKSEVGKEDREVLDTANRWKSQSGKLRGAVTTASATTPNGALKLASVPEIAEVMPIKTLKATEGGFTAPRACALCGLKREERVSRVDVDVNDSFGEWWVEGMNMHLVCKNWWDENKGKLKSR